MRIRPLTQTKKYAWRDGKVVEVSSETKDIFQTGLVRSYTMPKLNESHAIEFNCEAIARVCHEANRAYCQSLGDNSQLPWDEAPDWQRVSALDGVIAILDGRVTKPSDSHESWYKEKERNGWVYGPVKDPEKKEHPCMVQFEDLPREQQLKDHLFFSIVKALTV